MIEVKQSRSGFEVSKEQRPQNAEHRIQHYFI